MWTENERHIPFFWTPRFLCCFQFFSIVYLNIFETNNIKLQFRSPQSILASLKIQAKILNESCIVVVVVVPLFPPLLMSASVLWKTGILTAVKNIYLDLLLLLFLCLSVPRRYSVRTMKMKKPSNINRINVWPLWSWHGYYGRGTATMGKSMFCWCNVNMMSWKDWNSPVFFKVRYLQAEVVLSPTYCVTTLVQTFESRDVSWLKFHIQVLFCQNKSSLNYITY